MQLILNDISVSRKHCQLTIDDDGKIALQDCGSKFGSLVLIQADMVEILKGKSLIIQVGTNYLNIKLMLSRSLFGCCGVEEIDEKNSYEKINSNYVKYDRTNEILNESITPENSDNEEKNIENKELIDKQNEENKKHLELMGDEKEKHNENRNEQNQYDSIYNISTLKINSDKNIKIPDNIQIIKNRISSIISKGTLTGDSTTKIKNEDNKIEYKNENVILSENENEKDEEKKNNQNKENEDKKDIEKKSDEKKDNSNENNNKLIDDSESDIDDSDDSSEDSSNS